MAGPTALVTGGCGFVGAHLCLALVARGYAVAVLDDLRRGSPENLDATIRQDVEIVEADVRDGDRAERALRAIRPDVVVHLAAVHFIPDCDADPPTAVSINVGGTSSILDACRHFEAGIPVVFASTGAVYGPDLSPHTERSALDPTDIYGLTKLWGEQLLSLYARLTGSPTGVARLFNVFGPGETNPHLIPEIMEQLRAGGDLQLGNLDTERDYVYATDVAEALSGLVAHALAGKAATCNIGTGRPTSGRDLVSATAAAVGRSVRVESDPRRVRASDRPRLVADASRAAEVLGWRATTDLPTGLAATAERPFAPRARA